MMSYLARILSIGAGLSATMIMPMMMSTAAASTPPADMAGTGGPLVGGCRRARGGARPTRRPPPRPE